MPSRICSWLFDLFPFKNDNKELKFNPQTKHYYPKKYFQGDTFYFDTDPNICIDTTKKCGEGECYTSACKDICKFIEDPAVDPKNRNKCEIPLYMTLPGSGLCKQKGTEQMFLRNPTQLSSPPPTQQQLRQQRQIKQQQQIQQQQKQQQQSPPQPPSPPPQPPSPQIGPSW